MTTAMIIVPVNLPGREYAVEIGAGMLAALGDRIVEKTVARRATVITDDVVGPLYADRVCQSLTAAGITHAVISVPSGDEYKALGTAGEIYDALAELKHERDQPIIALGGGMIGDLAGFVAATWMRGVPLVQCPTTLEAAIDASIGGKTAVNHPRGKNLIGAFHQPILVMTDIDCLATLSDRDYRAALAESVKHAVVADAEFFEWQRQHAQKILARDSTIVRELIARNCRIKAAVVIADERESSRDAPGRAALNFGHTIGHALEAESRYALRHGEAVAMGLCAEIRLAEVHAGLARTDGDAIRQLLESLGLPVHYPGLISRNLLTWMGHDKKVDDGRLRFAVPTRIGDVRWIEDVPASDLLAAVASIT